MRIGIVEDEFLVADMIADQLRELNYEVSQPAPSYTRALAMVDEFKPDLLLVDIQLAGKKDGIDLAETLRNREERLPVIFLTANSDRVTIERAKQVKPDAYLVKPFNKRDIFAAIEIAFSNFSSAPKENTNAFPRFLFLKNGQSFEKIMVDEILFMEADHVYVKFFLTGNRQVMVRAQLKDYIPQLNPHLYFQCHRSFIINLTRVDKVDEQHIMINDFVVPVSRSNKSDMLQLLRALK